MVNKFVSFFLLLLIADNSFSQKVRKLKANPPGTVQVNDTLFADISEVANVHWREYLYYLLDINKDTQAYKEALPDTLVWITGYIENPLSQYYFRHPGFNNYLAAGISYEQVLKFCKWRTYVANQGIYFKENNIKAWKLHLEDTFPIRFYYRLPTKEEWEMIADPEIDSSGRIFRKFNGRSVFHFNTKEVADSMKRKTDPHLPFTPDVFTASVMSYFPNKYGMYNMIGNVAEMISEKGIAKGGSFIHPLYSCRIHMDQHYDQPERWLGFRCVAVVIK